MPTKRVHRIDILNKDGMEITPQGFLKLPVFAGRTGVQIYFDEDGNEIKEKESPLMDPRDIRLIISSLHMYLNSNTFLSLLDDERINDIMWDISQNLAILFYNVRNKISPHERSILWAQIEHSILFALYRAKGKITLDAISKTQQSHEIIQTAPSTPTEQQKEFKILGW